ncbi:MAG TPA: pyruvate dehydrogenase (acetyl-transferring) E1 component subunit alpha [Mycobacteriales bacterium]|nr:pyruvate dehydrogenase (acetyl-transferring) E1 component subunit alpha [Mycobacteriales bacterium]
MTVAPPVSLSSSGPSLDPDEVGVQLIAPDGRRTPNPTYDPFLADLDPAGLRGLYRDMLLIRRLDQESEALQRQGQLALWPSLLGQEAAQIGAGRALRSGDFAFPTYREHGLAHTRGVDWVHMLRFWRGTHTGAWNPREHNINTYSVVIPTQALHATGYAMGIQRRHRDDVALACFGDGATSQGDLSEAFVWAAVFDAPVVFLCQNNQWAISEPSRRQTKIPLYQRAAGYGFPGIRVDGNDVLAVRAVCMQALERARSGQGPTLVEAYTYRMGAHTTSDDPTRYRSPADARRWAPRDPVERYRRWLRTEGLWDDDAEADTQQAINAEAARVRAGCLALPEPQPAQLFDHVYAELPPPLREQRDGYLAYLETLRPEEF